MPVTDVKKDLDAPTLTVTAEFDAGIERLWQLWADPRQLERWWGPPSHPVTFTEYDFNSGGRAAYYTTGPDGERSDGLWRFDEVEEPSRLRIADAVVDDEGKPEDGGPATMVVTLSEAGGRATMTIETAFGDRESLEKMVEMGFEQGMREVLAKIDALLAD